MGYRQKILIFISVFLLSPMAGFAETVFLNTNGSYTPSPRGPNVRGRVVDVHLNGEFDLQLDPRFVEEMGEKIRLQLHNLKISNSLAFSGILSDRDVWCNLQYKHQGVYAANCQIKTLAWHPSHAYRFHGVGGLLMHAGIAGRDCTDEIAFRATGQPWLFEYSDQFECKTRE